MILKDRTIYKAGSGRKVTIMGRTKPFEQFVWSLAGDWYERGTGRYVFGWRKPDAKPDGFRSERREGDVAIMYDQHDYNLVEEIGAYE